MRTCANRQSVVKVSPEAAASKVRPGLTLAQARALCPGLEVGEHDPQRDRQALLALARWMGRFSPAVAVAPAPEPATPTRGKPAQPAPDAILIDLSGCERIAAMWAGESPGADCRRPMLTAIRAALARFRIAARAAIAPTVGAAWAAALAAPQDAVILDATTLRRDLAGLPVETLRIDPDLADTLRHLGLTTIGHLMQLPRESVAGRFGPLLLRRLDQCLGILHEPIEPLRPDEPVEGSMDFDGPVDCPQTLRRAFDLLLGPLLDRLRLRDAAAREIAVELRRPYGPPIHRTLGLARPSRDAGRIGRLFSLAVERLDPDDYANPEGTALGDGFVGMKLRIERPPRVDDEQLTLLEQQEQIAQRELDDLLDRLAMRLGRQAIVKARPVESHRPERAWEPQRAWEADRAPEPAGRPDPRRPVAAAHRVRPLTLLPTPAPVPMMTRPDDALDGRPVAFTHHGHTHRLVRVVGPERIAGEWWTGHDKTRDYFDATDTEGRRFWLFRVTQTRRWFLHGVFA